MRASGSKKHQGHGDPRGALGFDLRQSACSDAPRKWPMAYYPAHLEERRTLADGRSVLIRPVRAEDEAGERSFFARLCAEARRMRFMKFVAEVSDRLLRDFTHVDYAERMAFVCEATVDGVPRIVGEARYYAIPRSTSCDFGIVIADEWRRSGIAGLLMNALMRHASTQGFETMEGMVLRENRSMLRFVRALGFEVSPLADEPTLVRVCKKLARQPLSAAGAPAAPASRA
jgi:acetyltransferase